MLLDLLLFPKESDLMQSTRAARATSTIITVLGLLACSSCRTIAQTPTYEETVSFIFNGNKEWRSVKFGMIFRNELSDFDKSNCTVRIESGTRSGVVNFREVARWRWQPYAESGIQIGNLELQGDGTVFDGKYWVSRIETWSGCKKSCNFKTPVLDPLKLEAAFTHLWENFCPAAKMKVPF